MIKNSPNLFYMMSVEASSMSFQGDAFSVVLVMIGWISVLTLVSQLLNASRYTATFEIGAFRIERVIMK